MFEHDSQTLAALVVDNPDLERLEALLEQFNVFEALGVVRQELRHSDFLAFLLDPLQNHGLGDAFLRKLLQKAVVVGQSDTLPVTLIDLDIWSLEGVSGQREWRGIDILLLDDQHQLVVIIENKIDSQEHSNQLNRYRQVIRQHYPNWRTLALYLTPDGDEPSAVPRSRSSAHTCGCSRRGLGLGRCSANLCVA